MVRIQAVERAKKKIEESIQKWTCRRCGVRLEEEGKFCEKCAELEKEQMDFNRKKTRLNAETQIENLERYINFKQEQVVTGKIVETRIVKLSSTGEPTIIDGFVDSTKPKFILENEISELKGRQELFKEQLKGLKKAEEEDETSSSEGDKRTSSS